MIKSRVRKCMLEPYVLLCFHVRNTVNWWYNLKHHNCHVVTLSCCATGILKKRKTGVLLRCRGTTITYHTWWTVEKAPTYRTFGPLQYNSMKARQKDILEQQDSTADFCVLWVSYTCHQNWHVAVFVVKGNTFVCLRIPWILFTRRPWHSWLTSLPYTIHRTFEVTQMCTYTDRLVDISLLSYLIDYSRFPRGSGNLGIPGVSCSNIPSTSTDPLQILYHSWNITKTIEEIRFVIFGRILYNKYPWICYLISV